MQLYFIDIKYTSIVLLVVTFLPVFVFYNAIELDKPLFVTEWLKITFETLIIVFVLNVLELIREVKNKKKIDYKFIYNNLISYLEQNQILLSDISLTDINVKYGQRECQTIGRKLQLLWKNEQNFFDSQLYLQLSDQELVKNFLDLHLEIIDSSEFDTITKYLENIQTLSSEKLRATKAILSGIQKRVNQIAK